MLELCREDLGRLSPEPEEGWLLFTYDFARETLFPSPAAEERRERHGAGAVFFLSLLQVLLDAERDLMNIDLPEESEAAGGAHLDS